jgi:putative redox protein
LEVKGRFNMPTERFTFPGHSGHDLAARLDLPEGPHLATAVLAHCFTCGKDIPAARRISARLAAIGIAVLRFDFTGLGHSGGEFANTSFTSNVDDLLAAAQALSGRGIAPSLLIGHSLGGAAVLRAAGRIDSVRAVASIGAPFDPEHVTHNFGDALDRISAEGKAEVMLGGRPVSIGRRFVEDVRAEKLAPALATLKKALLVLHAPRDEIVGIDNATRIFTAARHPKSFVTLDEADHLLTRADDADYAAEVIAAWAGRYLDLRPPAPPPGVPEGVTRVSEADPQGFLQDVQAGARHHILADEPLSYGGTNRGLTPYQLLAAGLGACTSMTIRMYARRKGLLLSHVAVDVTHDRVHAQDAATPGTPIDRFTRRIRLEGDLDRAQQDKLLEIADKCPVHRTLERGADIVTELAPVAEAVTT